MVTYNMSTEPADARGGWQRLSGLSGDQSKPAEQSPPSYYAAPNHFATSNYNADVSPVTASAGSRRFGSSSYALPSALPSSIEMHDLGEPSQSPYNIPTTNNSNALPPPATQPTANTTWHHGYPGSGILVPCVLTLILLITSTSLHPPHFGAEPWSTTRWSRPGQKERLDVKQVIFATIPQKFIWATFLTALMLNVWVLQLVHWYGGFAAQENRKGKVCRVMKPLFFLIVVVIEAVLMWAWLLWAI